MFLLFSSMYGGNEVILLNLLLLLLYYGMMLFGVFYEVFELFVIEIGGMFYGVSYVVGSNNSNVLSKDEIKIC